VLQCSCGSPKAIVRWQFLSNGKTAIRGECLTCGKFIGYVRQLASTKAMATANVEMPRIDALALVHNKKKHQRQSGLASAIRYPREPSEAEIQCVLVHGLRKRGYDARAEVKQGACQFDIVVFDAHKVAVRIIEIKKHSHRHNKKVKHLRSRQQAQIRQIEKYSHFGVPVDFIQGMAHAKRYLATYATDASHTVYVPT